MATTAPTDFKVNGMFSTYTDVVMEVAFKDDQEVEKSTYDPGEPIEISVSLWKGGLVQASHTIGDGGPILGNAKNIWAVVSRASGELFPDDSATQTVTFTEQGNGLYTGVLDGSFTTAFGAYDFAVMATGTIPNPEDPSAPPIEFFRRLDQSVYVAAPYASAVVFAQKSVTMYDYSSIITGDVLVNEPVVPESQDVSLLVGLGASTPGGYVVKADRIQLLEGANIAGTVYTDEDPINAGTIVNPPVTGVSFPLFEGERGGFPEFDHAGGNLSPDYSVSTGRISHVAPPRPR